MKGLRSSRRRSQTSTNSKWEPGEKVADLFSSPPPPLEAQLLHKSGDLLCLSRGTVASVEVIRLVWLPFFSWFICFFSYSCWLGLTLPKITV